MGSFILCHNKKARVPYKIKRIHCRVYTLEELSYYLCNNLYLIDQTIANETLCNWLAEELGLDELAQTLRQILMQDHMIEQFVMSILSYTSIYTAAELTKIQQVLEQVRNQNPAEKQKCMADNLLESGSYKSAIDLYLEILRSETGKSEEAFLGKIYANLGAAYGRMFQYEDAAKMYEEAYKRLEDSKLLSPYIYACEKYMSAVTFQNMLSQNEIFKKMHEDHVLSIKELDSDEVWLEETCLKDWKEQYRRCAAGER